jgi:hypothetical protein
MDHTRDMEAQGLPSIGDDEGTPFAVGVIPVDDMLVVKVPAK